MAAQSIQTMRRMGETWHLSELKTWALCQIGNNDGKSLNSPPYFYQREIQPGELGSLERSDFEEQQENFPIRGILPSAWSYLLGLISISAKTALWSEITGSVSLLFTSVRLLTAMRSGVFSPLVSWSTICDIPWLATMSINKLCWAGEGQLGLILVEGHSTPGRFTSPASQIWQFFGSLVRDSSSWARLSASDAYGR